LGSVLTADAIKFFDARCQFFSAAELPKSNHPRSRMLNQSSIWLIQEACSGVKTKWNGPLCRIERFPRRPPVDVEIVSDDEDISLGVALRDRLNEFVQLFGSSPTATLTKQLSALNIKGRRQSHRSVPLVFLLKPPRGPA
jgi:hypothetical protein